MDVRVAYRQNRKATRCLFQHRVVLLVAECCVVSDCRDLIPLACVPAQRLEFPCSSTLLFFSLWIAWLSEVIKIAFRRFQFNLVPSWMVPAFFQNCSIMEVERLAHSSGGQGMWRESIVVALLHASQIMILLVLDLSCPLKARIGFVHFAQRS
jgi:hypothetical protein